MQQPAFGMQPAERPAVATGTGLGAVQLSESLECAVQLGKRGIQQRPCIGLRQPGRLSQRGCPALELGNLAADAARSGPGIVPPIVAVSTIVSAGPTLPAESRPAGRRDRLAAPSGSACGAPAPVSQVGELVKPTPAAGPGMCVDHPPRDFGGTQVASLGHLAHPLKRLVRAAAKRVHQDAFGLVDDCPGVRGVLQLGRYPARVVIVRNGTHQRSAVSHEQLGQLELVGFEGARPQAEEGQRDDRGAVWLSVTALRTPMRSAAAANSGQRVSLRVSAQLAGPPRAIASISGPRPLSTCTATRCDGSGWLDAWMASSPSRQTVTFAAAQPGT